MPISHCQSMEFYFQIHGNFIFIAMHLSFLLDTSRKQAISPGWEGPLVPVPQPGLMYRDKRVQPFSPGWLQIGTKPLPRGRQRAPGDGDIQSRLVTPTGTKDLGALGFMGLGFIVYFSFSFCVFDLIPFHFKHILRCYILYTLCIYNRISRRTNHIHRTFRTTMHTHMYNLVYTISPTICKSLHAGIRCNGILRREI